ncbi:MAG: internalin, partial [Euryarchaeota archaeon]|nr:internalin [Euryarchaeota archaeon]
EEDPVVKPYPDYEIEKSVTDVNCRGPAANVTKAGDVIKYQIKVTNTGNIGLTNVSVTDPLIKTLKGPVESKNVNGILDIGEIWTYTGCYKVAQEDMEINSECNRGSLMNAALVGCDSDTISKCYGYIDNVGTVNCDQLDPKSDNVRVIIEKVSTEEDSVEEDSIEKKSDYSIYKSIIGVDEAGDFVINEPGDIIEYQIIVKNEGNVNLTGVTVSDPMITLAGPIGDDLDPEVLNSGETWKFLGNYTVTQDDIESNGGGDGYIENMATVSCNELPSVNSSAKQPIFIALYDAHSGSGGTGNARVISKSTKNTVMGEKTEENTKEDIEGNIQIEPDIESFDQKDGGIKSNIEKGAEQEKNASAPGFELIYCIVWMIATFLYKKK